jgi:hypothetical protein
MSQYIKLEYLDMNHVLIIKESTFKEGKVDRRFHLLCGVPPLTGNINVGQPREEFFTVGGMVRVA